MPEGPSQPRHRQRVGGSVRSAALARYGILLWPAQTTASLTAAAGRSSWLRPSHRSLSAVAIELRRKRSATSGERPRQHQIMGRAANVLPGGSLDAHGADHRVGADRRFMCGGNSEP